MPERRASQPACIERVACHPEAVPTRRRGPPREWPFEQYHRQSVRRAHAPAMQPTPPARPSRPSGIQTFATIGSPYVDDGSMMKAKREAHGSRPSRDDILALLRRKQTGIAIVVEEQLRPRIGNVVDKQRQLELAGHIDTEAGVHEGI